MERITFKVKKVLEKDIMQYRDLMEELNTMLENAMKEERIELFHGRPVRNYPINKEDTINLKIALYCSKSLKEFLEQV